MEGSRRLDAQSATAEADAPAPGVPHPVASPAPADERHAGGASAARGVATGVAAFALYSALAVWLFRTAWSDPTHLSIGGSGDANLFMWMLTWTPFSLTHGLNPLLSDYLNYPGGLNMMWNGDPALVGLLLAPVNWWLGPVVTYNVAMTLAVAGSAWAASVAAGRIVGSRLAGVAAGLLYGFSPYMLAQAEGHLHQVIALFPPLALLLLWELLARDRWRPLWCGVGLGALAAAQLLTGEEILFSSGVVGALALVALVPFAGRAAVRGRLPRAALGLAAAGLTFAVLGAYPLWVQFFGPERVQAAVQLPDVFVTDLLNLVLPTHHQWLAPQRVLDVVFKFTGNGSEWDGYLGVPLVAVLLGTVVWLRRQRLVLWAALMVLGVAVLSLGPHLHVGGTVTTVRLPWRLVSKLPVFESVLPGRLAVLVVLFAALVVAALVARLRTAGLPARALAGAGLALTVVTLMPAPLSMAYLNPVSPFFGGRDVEVVPAGSVALVAPFSSAPGSRPTAAAYNEATWTMLWQAESGMRFRTPSGYVRIVGPGGPQLGPPASVTQDAMLRVQDGEGLPQLTPELRARLVADLRAWRVTSVVVGQMSDQDTMVALFTWLLEREPQRHGDVYVWLDVDPSRLS